MIYLDSCFLIDLLRETQAERPGPAFDLMESFDETEILAASVFVEAELRAGAELARRSRDQHAALDDLFAALFVAPPTAAFAGTYGRLRAATHRSGQTVTTMDLLIATSAIVDNAPLVTRNVRDFSRVPGLRLLSY